MNREASRRSFLLQMAGGAAFAPTAVAALGEYPPLPRGDEPDESYWELVRRQFAFREAKVPMNAANLCPSPRVVAERVTELTHDVDVDCSFNNRSKFRALREQSRSKVAELLGVDGDEIALVRNTSEANNTINNGLALRPGDEVVLWDQNHPTNNVAWDVRAARFGLRVERVSTPEHPEGIGQLVEVFGRALTPKTRVLAITHVSNVSGVRLPVKEICEVAHARGVHVHVDGAQTFGALDFSLRDLGCDSYSASSHKWFVGPKEAGVLYVRKDRIADVWPSVVAPGWGNDIEPDLEGARKFESLGQRDDACLAALGTAADFHATIGKQRVAARVEELASAVKSAARELDVPLVTPADPALSGGVCILEVPREHRRAVFERMYHEHGIAGAATGGWRLCPHVYNTREHVERAIAGVEALRGLMG